jgi:hypothetical protein
MAAKESMPMPPSGSDHLVTTLSELEALYEKPYGPAVIKEVG